MAKKISKDSIDILSQSKYVKNVRENRITFTFEFRMIMWNEWKNDPNTKTIRKVMNDYGIDCKLIGKDVIHSLNKNFKLGGQPSNGKNKVAGDYQIFHTNKEDNQYLISTGKFIKASGGISFHPDFINEIYHDYPDKSIEDKLTECGIDPDIVGYQRIYSLKQIFDGNGRVNNKRYFDDETVIKLSDHPYIKKISRYQLALTDKFYDDACIFRDLHIDDILDVFNIDHKLISVLKKNRIKYKLNKWNRADNSDDVESSPSMISINNNRITKLTEMIDDGFNTVKNSISFLSYPSRKAVCQWIKVLPHDRYDFTITNILKKTGISKSSYYSIIHSNGHDISDSHDAEDITLIKKVLDSEKYPMGSRMVHMKMKSITGVQFSRKKIMRLMKKYGLLCQVRKSNISRQTANKMLKRNVKPNILKRKFRFYRPLTVVLTDVSYLKYSSNKTAYLSAIKDPASGRILACAVSDCNDLQLVDDTLDQLDYHFSDGTLIFHSDQGTLYLSDHIQRRIKAMGFTQSMSRRGNCWDNSSQESYFGHFKDECDYKGCSTVDEVRKTVLEYIEYYNYRRPQWCRNKMTPVEFEKYLLDMDDEEFKKYVDKEKEKYDNMMKKAKEKAIARAHDIGVL